MFVVTVQSDHLDHFQMVIMTTRTIVMNMMMITLFVMNMMTITMIVMKKVTTVEIRLDTTSFLGLMKNEATDFKWKKWSDVKELRCSMN